MSFFAGMDRDIKASAVYRQEGQPRRHERG
jgi:hypothetical protein